ncbi:MAG: cysteine-rich CWC family protein [Myxococcota bacterium]
MPEPKLDTSLCPLCGKSNSCAVVSGSKEPCWCTSVSISRETLARIPQEAVDRACLCPRCAGLEQALSTDVASVKLSSE